jgi:P-type Cu+ transporter
MSDRRTVPATEDPVCGMTVEPAAARETGLTLTHDGREYAFCGKGCMLEFRDDPEKYLDPNYSPSM